MNNAFIKALIDDYVELGFGTYGEDDNVLVSTADGKELTLDPVEEAGKTVGVSLTTDGVELDSYLYEEEAFADRLSSALLAQLNV